MELKKNQTKKNKKKRQKKKFKFYYLINILFYNSN